MVCSVLNTIPSTTSRMKLPVGRGRWMICKTCSPVVSDLQIAHPDRPNQYKTHQNGDAPTSKHHERSREVTMEVFHTFQRLRVSVKGPGSTTNCHGEDTHLVPKVMGCQQGTTSSVSVDGGQIGRACSYPVVGRARGVRTSEKVARCEIKKFGRRPLGRN